MDTSASSRPVYNNWTGLSPFCNTIAFLFMFLAIVGALIGGWHFFYNLPQESIRHTVPVLEDEIQNIPSPHSPYYHEDEPRTIAV